MKACALWQPLQDAIAVAAPAVKVPRSASASFPVGASEDGSARRRRRSKAETFEARLAPLLPDKVGQAARQQPSRSEQSTRRDRLRPGRRPHRSASCAVVALVCAAAAAAAAASAALSAEAQPRAELPCSPHEAATWHPRAMTKSHARGLRHRTAVSWPRSRPGSPRCEGARRVRRRYACGSRRYRRARSPRPRCQACAAPCPRTALAPRRPAHPRHLPRCRPGRDSRVGRTRPVATHPPRGRPT